MLGQARVRTGGGGGYARAFAVPFHTQPPRLAALPLLLRESGRVPAKPPPPPPKNRQEAQTQCGTSPGLGLLPRPSTPGVAKKCYDCAHKCASRCVPRTGHCCGGMAVAAAPGLTEREGGQKHGKEGGKLHVRLFALFRQGTASKTTGTELCQVGCSLVRPKLHSPQVS